MTVHESRSVATHLECTETGETIESDQLTSLFGGGAVAVPDHQMAGSVAYMGAVTGVFAAPEGGATPAAVPMFLERGLISSDDKVVLFNAGSGLKHIGSTPLD